jgi:integrase
MSAFALLIRAKLKALKPGESLSEHGIVYKRLANDGRWSINVMIDRQRHHRVIGFESAGYTRKQAEGAIARLRAGIDAFLPKKRTSVRFAQAVKDYLQYLASHDGKDIASKSMRFREHLVPFLGAIQIDKITDDHWLAYVDRRKKESASPATINRERSALLHMFNTMRRRKQIQAIPMLARQREPAGKLTYLLPEESQRLVEAAKLDQSPHALPFVMIGLFTGLRHSPILNLRAGDVDAARRILWIGKDKAGRREQPMPQALADYLSDLIRDLSPEQCLFGSSKSSTGRVHQMNTIFARCVERAGITKHVTPHTLRHTAATNAAHAGLDAATIQAMGGWKTRAMAALYSCCLDAGGYGRSAETSDWGANYT